MTRPPSLRDSCREAEELMSALGVKGRENGPNKSFIFLHCELSLVLFFQYLKGTYRKGGERLFFTSARSDRTVGKGFKQIESRFRLDIRKKSFTVRVMRPCTGCPVGLWLPHP